MTRRQAGESKMARLSLLLLSALLAIVTCERKTVPDGVQPLSNEMVAFINSINTTWKAGPNFQRSNFKLENIQSLFGVKAKPHSLKVKEQIIDANVKIPDSFDSRDQWPNCPSLREVRDQSNCGSCWAFATAEAITDRVCIATGGSFQQDISAQDLMTCCSECGNGCHGGEPLTAWQYWVDHGIVTGGLYNGTGCEPYSIPPHHHGEPYRDTPACTHKCVKKGDDYDQSKSFGKSAYLLASEEDIKYDILTNGPVGADFTVYADFPSYKSGVYQRHSTEAFGGHAIKLIGWGTEDGTPYWLGVNSWNTEWGNNGFFKFLRGSNECGIESDVVAGLLKK